MYYCLKFLTVYRYFLVCARYLHAPMQHFGGFTDTCTHAKIMAHRTTRHTAHGAAGTLVQPTANGGKGQTVNPGNAHTAGKYSSIVHNAAFGACGRVPKLASGASLYRTPRKSSGAA